MGGGDRLGLGRPAFPQPDAQQRHRTHDQKLALPVLERLESELGGGQEAEHRHRLVAMGELLVLNSAVPPMEEHWPTEEPYEGWSEVRVQDLAWIHRSAPMR